MTSTAFNAYLSECRQLTLREIEEIIPRDRRYRSLLYDLMLDYPLRAAKALRPALCIATCRALGGWLEAVLRSAAVLELYHNAFLIHDDVEDGSEHRRGLPTLHTRYGTPTAVNVGDAMLALALQPLLDNMRLIGLGKALRIMQVIARMSRESTEGQAIELEWIRDEAWQLADADYVRMVYKKTSWYTFISPMLMGGIVAGASPERLVALRKFAALLGIAFQIQDDVLNLTAEGDAYGKEVAGDLWEGKRTLILLHAVRCAGASERDHAKEILGKPRPQVGLQEPPRLDAVRTAIHAVHQQGDLTASGRQALERALETTSGGHGVKTGADVQYLLALIARTHSIDYARAVAQRYARKAAALLEATACLLPSVHRDFLEGLVAFVIDRNR